MDLNKNIEEFKNYENIEDINQIINHGKLVSQSLFY